MSDVDHILNKEKILKNFSISKYISPKEIKKLKETLSMDNFFNEEDLNEALKEKLIEYTDNYIKTHKIPGLIIKHTNKFNIQDKSSAKIYKEAAEFAYKLKFEKKMTKPQMLFFIISLVNHLGFTQEDFNDLTDDSDESDDSSIF